MSRLSALAKIGNLLLYRPAGPGAAQLGGLDFDDKAAYYRQCGVERMFPEFSGSVVSGRYRCAARGRAWARGSRGRRSAARCAACSCLLRLMPRLAPPAMAVTPAPAPPPSALPQRHQVQLRGVAQQEPGHRAQAGADLGAGRQRPGGRAAAAAAAAAAERLAGVMLACGAARGGPGAGRGVRGAAQGRDPRASQRKRLQRVRLQLASQ